MKHTALSIAMCAMLAVPAYAQRGNVNGRMPDVIGQAVSIAGGLDVLATNGCYQKTGGPVSGLITANGGLVSTAAVSGIISDATAVPTGSTRSDTIDNYLGDLSRIVEYTARPIQIFAHRGYQSIQPQNTMRAFRYSIGAGIAGDGFIETDIEVSSDGVPVCFHDATLDAITTGTGPVMSNDYATLLGLVIDVPGVSTNYIPATERVIPALTNLLVLAKETHTPVIAEFKQYRAQSDIAIIMAAVSNAAMDSLFVYQCKTLSDCNYVRGIDTKARIAYFGVSNSLAGMQNEIIAVTNLGNAFYFNDQANFTANPSIVSYAYTRNVDLAAYTVTTHAQMRTLTAIGINRIFSDVPLNTYSIAESTTPVLFYDYPNSYLGIHTITPETPLHIRDNAAAYVRLDGYGSAVAGIQTYAVGGTYESPSAIAADRLIGLWSMRGYDGNFNAYASAYIGGYSSQIWTPTANGTHIRFATTPNNSITSAERMRINEAGRVGIGVTNPLAKLHVNGNAYIDGWEVRPVYTLAGVNTGTNAFKRFMWEPAVGSNGWMVILATNPPSYTTPKASITNTVWLAPASL